MMLSFTGKLRSLVLASTLISAGSFFSLAQAAPTYALVQINQQALFFLI